VPNDRIHLFDEGGNALYNPPLPAKRTQAPEQPQ
jgi:hypothetical protein